MTLSEKLAENIRTCFAGIWIESCEHDDAILEIGRLCHQENWQLATWDINQGNETSGADPLAAVRSLDSMATDDDTPALLVLTNFHRFLGSAEIIQAVADQIQRGKNRRTFLVILAPVVQIPTELEKLFICIEHELPNREQLEEIARGVATEEGELPEGDELTQVLDAA